jgi:outer membrane lipoprotein-sorting protein
MKIKMFASLIIVFFTGFLSAVSAQSVDEIISKHIAAMGGAQRFSKVQSVRITADMQVMGKQVPVVTTIVQDKAFRSETTVEGMTIVQAVNGTAGWIINPMTGSAKATALPEETVKAMAAETDLTGLFDYKKKGYALTLEGEDDLGGAKVYKVGMTTKNGIKRVNYISKDTFYILKITVQGKVGDQEIQSVNTQSDFREVDGIFYPFTSEVSTSAMPGAAMVLKIKTLEINPKIDEQIFAMPQ